jgi:hypothetical protein
MSLLSTKLSIISSRLPWLEHRNRKVQSSKSLLR